MADQDRRRRTSSPQQSSPSRVRKCCPSLRRRDNRRFYFVRRTLGTLSELRDAIAALELNATFQARKAAWPDGAREGWTKAVAFLSFANTPAAVRVTCIRFSLSRSK